MPGLNELMKSFRIRSHNWSVPTICDVAQNRVDSYYLLISMMQAFSFGWSEIAKVAFFIISDHCQYGLGKYTSLGDLLGYVINVWKGPLKRIVEFVQSPWTFLQSVVRRTFSLFTIMQISMLTLFIKFWNEWFTKNKNCSKH